MGQPDLDPNRLIFIDGRERSASGSSVVSVVSVVSDGTSTKMARTHGQAPRGQRLRAPVPHGHWKTTTFVGALRTIGMVAPMVLGGPINGVAFQAYVEQVLVPELRPATLSSWTTLAATKARASGRQSRQRGHASSSCRPIAPSQSDREGLLQAEGHAAKGRRAHRQRPLESHRSHHRRFTPAECINYFIVAGYEPD